MYKYNDPATQFSTETGMIRQVAGVHVVAHGEDRM